MPGSTVLMKPNSSGKLHHYSPENGGGSTCDFCRVSAIERNNWPEAHIFASYANAARATLVPCAALDSAG